MNRCLCRLIAFHLQLFYNRMQDVRILVGRVLESSAWLVWIHLWIMQIAIVRMGFIRIPLKNNVCNVIRNVQHAQVWMFVHHAFQAIKDGYKVAIVCVWGDIQNIQSSTLHVWQHACLLLILASQEPMSALDVLQLQCR